MIVIVSLIGLALWLYLGYLMFQLARRKPNRAAIRQMALMPTLGGDEFAALTGGEIWAHWTLPAEVSLPRDWRAGRMAHIDEDESLPVEVYFGSQGVRFRRDFYPWSSQFLALIRAGGDNLSGNVDAAPPPRLAALNLTMRRSRWSRYASSEWETAVSLPVPAGHEEEAAIIADRLQSWVHERNGDDSEAASIYRRFADCGDAFGERKLGFLYLMGRGVAKDESEAQRWLRKAAAQGDGDAEFALGLSCETGSGTEPDCAQAAEWYRKAAERGGVEAQSRLGQLFDRGDGVEQNNLEAYFWLDLAASRAIHQAATQDQKENLQTRDGLRRKMTPDEIGEAERRAVEWIARRYPYSYRSVLLLKNSRLERLVRESSGAAADRI